MFQSLADMIRGWPNWAKAWLPTFIALGSLLLFLVKAYESNAWDREVDKATAEIKLDIARRDQAAETQRLTTYEDLTRGQNLINAKIMELIEAVSRRVEVQEVEGQVADLTSEINDLVRQQRAMPPEQQWQFDELLSVRRQELSRLIDRKLDLNVQD